MAENSIPRTSGIYKIVCVIANKCYVGSTANLQRRWTEHQRRLNTNKHDNRHLQFAWNKYGSECFTFEVIEECDQIFLLEREQFYLDSLSPFGENGYNLALDASAAMRGRKMTPETCAKISAGNKGKVRSPETRAKMSIANKGKKMSPEAIAKMSAAKKGKKLSPEHKAKVSAGNKGRRKPPEAVARTNAKNRGQKRTPEQRAKMGAANKGRRHTPETRTRMSTAQKSRTRLPGIGANISAGKSKQTYILTTPDGTQMEIRNLSQFCREHDLCPGHMYDVISGKRNHHHGWKVRRNRPDTHQADYDELAEAS